MYELKIEEKSSYLLVTVHGETNQAIDLEIDAEIRRECESRNIELVLIDIRPMTTRLSSSENHVDAKTFRQRMGPGIRAVAIVDAKEFKQQSGIFELTATNRGARVKFFEDPAAAASWLLERLK